MGATVITIPIPPSVNSIYVNVPKRGRVKSGAYVRWIKTAGWELQCQPHPRVPGRVNVLIEIRRPSANSDVDNRIKATLDLLVSHGVIDDDRNVASVRAVWADIDSCRVTVEAA